MALFRRISMVQNMRYSTNSPLDHVKVLDLSRIVAGPYCTMILGDLGAKVYKVEVPNIGDETRLWPPHINYSKDEMTCYFGAINRNKKSICINFKSKKGIEIIHRLAEKCDVLVENFVPGKLDSLGLGYNDIKKIAPHIIYCSITGFGPSGPYRDRMGYDIIAASIGGLFHITGPKDGDPCKTGVAMTDLSTGLYAHGAIMAALIQRTKTGKGQKIDCDLLSTQVACLINIGSNYLNAGKEAKRWGTEHESIVILQSFKTSDGYITIGTGNDTQFQTFCQRFNLDLNQKEKFKTNSQRVKNRDELLQILEPIFIKMTNDEVLKILEGAPFPFGPVNTMKQDVRTIKVTLKKPKTDKQVKWTSETVDNEHLNRKKSKCCCIYEKPRVFGESSSEDEGECENCFGHVELKKHSHKPPSPEPPETSSPT